jgi:hypothetical protein
MAKKREGKTKKEERRNGMEEGWKEKKGRKVK